MDLAPFETYDELLDAVDDAGASYRVRNYTPTGQPILDVEVGGDRQPAVLVTAGAHATEQAGVTAAVELLDRLDTDHEVHVIPSRDPIGLNGYPDALSEVTGRDVEIESFDDLERFLRERAHVVHREGDFVLALLGDVGFATRRPEPDGDSTQLSLLKHLKWIQHERPRLLEPFRGRRILVPAGQDGIPGSGTFRRAYTLVVGPGGRLLHLNRFFDTPWAPAEVECTRTVMAEIEPALTFDLHETQLVGDRFYVNVHGHGADEAWERRLGERLRAAAAGAGAEFASDADLARVQNVIVADPDETPADEPTGAERVAEGCYRYPDPSAGAEGFNAGHLAARNYGPAIGTETGMWGSFEDRVEILTAVVEAGVAELEARHG